MKSQFKPGDKVRCIDDKFTDGALVQDQIYTIKDVVYNELLIDGSPIQWKAKRFELVDELDALLETAERGREAARELVEKYKDDIEYDDGDGVLDGNSWGLKFAFRRKKQKPFKLPDSGYECRLDDKVLTVGCKQFPNSKAVLEALQAVCIEKHSQSLSIEPGYGLHSTRDGVGFKQHIISWSDADALLAWLEGKSS